MIKNLYTGQVLYKDRRPLRKSLEKAVRDGVNLSGANLIGANLSGLDLRGARLPHAILTGAQLSDANLSGAFLYDACLERADLAGAGLSYSDISEACLKHAVCVRTRFLNAHMDGADFTSADLMGASLSGEIHAVDFRFASFIAANLMDAKFVFCDFHEANFGDAVVDNPGVPGFQLSPYEILSGVTGTVSLIWLHKRSALEILPVPAGTVIEEASVVHARRWASYLRHDILDAYEVSVNTEDLIIPETCRGSFTAKKFTVGRRVNLW